MGWLHRHLLRACLAVGHSCASEREMEGQGVSSIPVSVMLSVVSLCFFSSFGLGLVV